MRMMHKLLVGNAPCSWGMLEFDEAKGSEPIGYRQMLDELVEAGYTGTEFGDWGYMPTDSSALRAELTSRDLTMLGAFVPVALKNPAAHAGGHRYRRAHRETAGRCAAGPAAGARGRQRNRPRAPEVCRAYHAGMGLSQPEWKTFAAGADRLARAVHDETGLRTVFHHHCAGYVETPAEIFHSAGAHRSQTAGTGL